MYCGRLFTRDHFRHISAFCPTYLNLAAELDREHTLWHAWKKARPAYQHSKLQVMVQVLKPPSWNTQIHKHLIYMWFIYMWHKINFSLHGVLTYSCFGAKVWAQQNTTKIAQANLHSQNAPYTSMINCQENIKSTNSRIFTLIWWGIPFKAQMGKRPMTQISWYKCTSRIGRIQVLWCSSTRAIAQTSLLRWCASSCKTCWFKATQWQALTTWIWQMKILQHWIKCSTSPRSRRASLRPMICAIIAQQQRTVRRSPVGGST